MSVERKLSQRGSALPPLELVARAEPVGRRALLVTGNPEARDSTSVALLAAGFEVSVAASGAAALHRLRDGAVDLILLDALLPDRSGIDLLREIRAHDDDVPVIMLGAQEKGADRILSLELGADDYVADPRSPPELAARARAILRRRQRQIGVSSTLAVGSLRIDLMRHEVTLGVRSITVTASEFRLLELLCGNPGAVFTRRQIMEHLWAGPYFGDGHPVDTHVLNLRAKIETDPARPRRLLTVRGIGFKLVVPDGDAEAGAESPLPHA